ncbi:MAG: IclR family transcriptional regulator [Thermodesulfobacteriota bacterium]
MSIQAIQRASSILALFSLARPRLGITEISQTLGLNKPTVHGLVKTLAECGFLEQDPDTRKYSLGLKIYELGVILAGSLRINQVGAGPAQRLATQTGLVCRLAIWDRNAVLVTLNLFPNSRDVQFQQLGPRVPAFCTALGKAILAALPPRELRAYLKGLKFFRFTPYTVTDRPSLEKELIESRRRGWTEDRKECLMGLACLASAIYDHTGRPTASLSLSGDRDQVFGGGIKTRAHQLVQTAREISRCLGHHPGASSPEG